MMVSRFGGIDLATSSFMRRSKKGHWFYGSSFKISGKRYWFESGSLQRAIYHVHSKENSNDSGRNTYHVSWNWKKAPYGYMVEFGTVKARAHPFLRPAYNNNLPRAEQGAWVDVIRVEHRLQGR